MTCQSSSPIEVGLRFTGTFKPYLLRASSRSVEGVIFGLHSKAPTSPHPHILLPRFRERPTSLFWEKEGLQASTPRPLTLSDPEIFFSSLRTVKAWLLESTVTFRSPMHMHHLLLELSSELPPRALTWAVTGRRTDATGFPGRIMSMSYHLRHVYTCLTRPDILASFWREKNDLERHIWPRPFEPINQGVGPKL